MEPAQALADLTEISPQLETAVLAAPDGSVVASTIGDEGRSGEIATRFTKSRSGARFPSLRTAMSQGCSTMT